MQILGAKCNLLETLKRGGKPDRLVNMREPFELMPDTVILREQ